MKKLISLMITLTLLAIATTPVLAQGKGTIRIEPHSSYYPFPIMLESPATFNISVMQNTEPTCQPHLLLIITNDTYHQLVDGSITVTVNWTATDLVTINVGDWNGPETDNSKDIPDNAPLESGIGYNVATLQDHINTTGPIYWNFTSFLGDGAYLTQTPQEFTVTVPAPNPRMLVYALGKIGQYNNPGGIICPGSAAPFNNRVPPTKPGLVIPELATILLATASFGALALYAIRRKKILHPK